MKYPAICNKGAINIVVSVILFFGPILAVKAAELEEIIVTAQKRSQNIQDVPIAITAFTSDFLKQKGLNNNIAQIAAFTPNVVMDPTSPFAGSSSVLSPYIRGVGQNDFAFNKDPGVGIYVDGVYYARTIGANVDLLDVDHIEVLKGPQGTLFGRNNLGGAVSIVTRRPVDEFTFKGEVTTGRFQRVDVRGSVDMPIIKDKLLSSVAFSTKNRDGYQHRIPFNSPTPFVTDSNFLLPNQISHDTAGGQNEKDIRGKLLWIANENLEVTLTADYTTVDEQATPNTTLAIDLGQGPGSIGGTLAELYNTCIGLPINPTGPVPVGLATFGLVPICTTPRAVVGTSLADPVTGGVNSITDTTNTNDRLFYGPQFITGTFTTSTSPSLAGGQLFTAAKIDPDVSFATGPDPSLLDNFGASWTIDWDYSDYLKVKYIGAWRKVFEQGGLDFDGSPITILEVVTDTKQQQFTHELQLSGSVFDGSVKWLLGGFYFTEHGDLTDFVPFPGGLLQIFGQNFFDTESEALFTHVNYSFNDRLSFTAGFRFTNEHKEFEGKQKDLNRLLILGGLGGAAPPDGATAADFPDPTDTTLFFPPGVNNKDFIDISKRFGLEYRFTDEILFYFSFSEGFKSGGWTTRLSFPLKTAPSFDEETATTYEVGIKSELFDRRLKVNMAGFFNFYDGVQLEIQRGISPTFENGGDAEIPGFELEFTGLVMDDFVIDGSVGYLDAHYTRIDPKAPAALTINNRLPNAPDWSVHGGGQYTLRLTNGASIRMRTDYSWTSTIANDTENTPILIQDDVGLLSASVTYTMPDEHWSLTAGGTNITDERYIFTGQNNTGAGITNGTFNRPAEWYLTLSYNN